MPTRYLTGASTPGSEAAAFECSIGLMVQPGNSTHRKVGLYPFWAADNGAFTRRKAGFDPEKFRHMLRQPMLGEHAANCLFVVAPDKLTVLPSGRVVGDAAGTLSQFEPWAREIREAGFPVALVAQDGLESIVEQVPWDLVDVLFIGGSDEWKLSLAAKRLIAVANSYGKATHMGRVNSYKRMARATAMLCDTVDGTYLMFGPKTNLPLMRKWFEKLKAGVQLSFDL